MRSPTGLLPVLLGHTVQPAWARLDRRRAGGSGWLRGLLSQLEALEAAYPYHLAGGAAHLCHKISYRLRAVADERLAEQRQFLFAPLSSFRDVFLIHKLRVH